MSPVTHLSTTQFTVTHPVEFLAQLADVAPTVTVHAGDVAEHSLWLTSDQWLDGETVARLLSGYLSYGCAAVVIGTIADTLHGESLPAAGGWVVSRGGYDEMNLWDALIESAARRGVVSAPAEA